MWSQGQACFFTSMMQRYNQAGSRFSCYVSSPKHRIHCCCVWKSGLGAQLCRQAEGPWLESSVVGGWAWGLCPQRWAAGRPGGAGPRGGDGRGWGEVGSRAGHPQRSCSRTMGRGHSGPWQELVMVWRMVQPFLLLVAVLCVCSGTVSCWSVRIIHPGEAVALREVFWSVLPFVITVSLQSSFASHGNLGKGR